MQEIQNPNHLILSEDLNSDLRNDCLFKNKTKQHSYSKIQ